MDEVEKIAQLITGHMTIYVLLKTTLGPLLFIGITTSFTDVSNHIKENEAHVVLEVEIMKGRVRKLRQLAFNDWEIMENGRKKNEQQVGIIE